MKKLELHPLKVAALEEKDKLSKEPKGVDRKQQSKISRKSILIDMVLERVDLVTNAENKQMGWLKDIENAVKDLGTLGIVLHREPTPIDPVETVPCGDVVADVTTPLEEVDKELEENAANHEKIRDDSIDDPKTGVL